ncbi:hypothetical protein [Streptomyces iconiensis]|uniref:Lipoprotein n=1 Tax=Streptomyces iconiensis TaxID=1384038 RepID=A0ABT6ZWC0_9ACTN|nr:hypothetical protein [Streptomyces iconiensis]MDJ1133349.1 hypothetical protein [Streptomyces iconiensis]
MRIHVMRAAVLTAGCAMVFALAANGCAGSAGSGGGTGGSAHATASAPATGPGAFLARGECGTRNRQRVEEVPCQGERAAAKVIARHEGTRANGPRCPARTDYVLHISERRPASDDSGDAGVTRGYACMRALEAPHPGDPGGGGGPLTVVGDCVYTTGRDSEVKETPCDAVPGRHPPEFRVDRRVTERDRCPPDTDLYIDLGGTRPVGCAYRV